VTGLAHRLARTLLGPYEIYRIYRLDLSLAVPPAKETADLGAVLDADELARSPDPGIRDLATYAGAEALGFAARDHGTVVSACWYWIGERYETRGFWPLAPGEAKLVQITTAGGFRGRGLASQLLLYSAAEMRRRGFRKLYARIWHNHAPSIATFEKVGWGYVALVIRVWPFGRFGPLRFVRRRRSVGV